MPLSLPLPVDDWLAVLEVAARYNHAIDGGDVDAWLATWTADGLFEPTGERFEGQEGLRRFAVGWVEKMQNTRHWNTNFLIRGQGDTATMSCYLNLFGVKGSAKLLASGRYDDTLVKVGGAWKFQSRKVTVDK